MRYGRLDWIARGFECEDEFFFLNWFSSCSHEDLESLEHGRWSLVAGAWRPWSMVAGAWRPWSMVARGWSLEDGVLGAWSLEPGRWSLASLEHGR
jgi:hypothetical protein